MSDGSCVYAEIGYDCDGNITADIGDIMAGGYLFYLDESSTRGLVAAMEDIEGTYEWGCYGTELPGADGQAIGFGLQNTNDIVTGCAETLTGANIALDYESDEFDDWYLPSRNELAEMYGSISFGGPNGNIGGFSDIVPRYWSSSENSAVKAHIWSLFDGGTYYFYKNHSYKVRPIRALGNWTMGCMDETAYNYNSEANMSDGSCIDIVSGCMDSIACNYNSVANVSNDSCELPSIGYDCDGNVTAEIGDVMEGGYLFYIDETGQHGLVAALEDITDGSNMGSWGTEEGFEWGCYYQSVSGVDGTSIGTGYQNTLDIVAQNCQTQNGGITAAQATLNYSAEGYTNWFLPSKDELQEMNNTIGNGDSQDNIGGFDVSDYPYYWSSSEYSSNLALRVGFGDGNPGNDNKYDSHRVRAIRAF